MRNILRVVPFLVILLLQPHCMGMPRNVFDRGIIDKYLLSPDSFKPIPQANDSYWQKNYSQEFRSDYIKLGYKYKGRAWNFIPDSVFSEYRRNGNRINYEVMNFDIRRQMACLVMAEIMEYKGLLLKDIINGLIFFINEKWWGVPAHYPTNTPNKENQVVDLFNSETANLLAWTVYMLQDELEKAKPGICGSVKMEINRRILIPARNGDYGWKKSTGNWNTWICANWLSCILLCETDKEQQANDIKQVLTCLEYFMDGYSDDGGCEEGAHYWDRAAASLFECIYILNLATNGLFDLSDNAKFKNMGSYIYKSYITKNATINFADTPANTLININILYPYGKYINDPIMTGYAAMIAQDNNYKQKPSTLFYRSGNYPSLSRELLFLTEYDSFEKCEPKEPLARDIWLPDLQVFTARSNSQSTKGLFITAKGGHNDENHNHNDIGNFIVYSGAIPLFIDLGFNRYTDKTFSDKRYELTNCRSAYHNVPIINGFEQHAGREYRASNVKYHQDNKRVTFTLNIEDAYPREAEVKNWKRTVQFYRDNRIVITEEYRLGRYLNQSEIVLIGYGEAMLGKNGHIDIIANKEIHRVLYDSKRLTPVIEKLQVDDNGSWYDKPLYRIRMIIRNENLKGKIRYTIL